MESPNKNRRRPAISDYKRREEKLKMDKIYRRFVAMGLVIVLLLIACIAVYQYRINQIQLDSPFDLSSNESGFSQLFSSQTHASSYADEICVSPDTVNLEGVSLNAGAAGVFSEGDKSVPYAKGIHEKIYPASLTKIMTTLVALKYGNLDDLVTVGPECRDIEMGSSVCEIHEGDQLSLRMLLYGLMINSGNDAAMTIAKHVGGSVDRFVELMNEEAQEIGATNSHFKNPHGLHDEEHYTTVYDIYLTFHHALEYDIFQEIISQKTYYASFLNENNQETGVMWESTNHYFINEATPPADVEVIGGKTGTTSQAGACLCLYSKNKFGDPYITIVVKAQTKDALYPEMNQLLNVINN